MLISPQRTILASIFLTFLVRQTMESWDWMGYPLPDLGLGTPPDLGQGTPQTWDGVPLTWDGVTLPDLGWGTPLDLAWSTPPDLGQGTSPDLGQGTTPSGPGTGYPLVLGWGTPPRPEMGYPQTLDGVPPPASMLCTCTAASVAMVIYAHLTHLNKPLHGGSPLEFIRDRS